MHEQPYGSPPPSRYWWWNILSKSFKELGSGIHKSLNVTDGNTFRGDPVLSGFVIVGKRSERGNPCVYHILGFEAVLDFLRQLTG